MVYRSNLKAPATLSTCRLSALKLSQQGQASLSAVLADNVSFPCRCSETIAFHLDRLKYNLERYTAHNCWDIFFQAPWVAGNHVIEMLDLYFYYRMRLFRYRHYVGSVLHSYNVLVQLSAMDKIPLLEALCKKMVKVFFPGGERPTNRFAARWARFVGARLKFKEGHRGHNHRESWCMAIPSHTAKRAAGLGVFTNGQACSTEDIGINKILDLKRVDYHVNDSTWNNIDKISAVGGFETKERNRTGSAGPWYSAEGVSSSHQPSIHTKSLRTLSSYLYQDLEGTLPMLRLNLFAVFETFVQIVAAISNATHTDPKDKKIRCICFATTVLSGGDRIKDNVAIGRLDCWKRSNGERKVVEDAKKVILEVLSNVKEEDWLWSI